MKIYTRRGDAGETALFGGGRVGKHDLRVDAYGTVDELNAVLGWTVTQVDDEQVRERLTALQHDLFSIGAELATPTGRGGRGRPQTPALPHERVAEMESWMDDADHELPELTAFLLPGGTPGSAALHIARTVCRRAERTVVRLGESQEIDRAVITYLNRLSDLLFTFARLENVRSGLGEIEWEKEDS
jgi:cob(I)alamin adenosyltransferase